MMSGGVLDIQCGRRPEEGKRRSRRKQGKIILLAWGFTAMIQNLAYQTWLGFMIIKLCLLYPCQMLCSMPE
jgi:hypothetical protein